LAQDDRRGNCGRSAKDAEYMTEHKDHRMKLENQLATLRDEILDGQQVLPIAGD
jgi:hypothetical protein